MSSLRRIHASRANGARSRGPITLEGKDRSSVNSLRHGLLAENLILLNESRPCFDDLVAQHTARFAPADGVEFAMIEEMVAANWRMRRAWGIENRLMERAIRHQPPGDDEVERLAAAFSELAASPELNLVHRYEARLHRIYQRALNNLMMLREPELPELPNEPSPISEHQPQEEEPQPPPPEAPPPLPDPEPCLAELPPEQHHEIRSAQKQPVRPAGVIGACIMEDAAQSVDQAEPGIFDLRGGSDKFGLDGAPYSDW